MGSPRIIVDDARFAVIVGVMKCGGSGVGMGVATVVGIVVGIVVTRVSLLLIVSFSAETNGDNNAHAIINPTRMVFNAIFNVIL